MDEKIKTEKVLLNLEEFAQYLGIGKTMARKILKEKNTFSIKIGNRIYANKFLLDIWLNRHSGNK